jgi:hypothetical protein
VSILLWLRYARVHSDGGVYGLLSCARHHQLSCEASGLNNRNNRPQGTNTGTDAPLPASRSADMTDSLSNRATNADPQTAYLIIRLQSNVDTKPTIRSLEPLIFAAYNYPEHEPNDDYRSVTRRGCIPGHPMKCVHLNAGIPKSGHELIEVDSQIYWAYHDVYAKLAKLVFDTTMMEAKNARNYTSRVEHRRTGDTDKAHLHLDGGGSEPDVYMWWEVLHFQVVV